MNNLVEKSTQDFILSRPRYELFTSKMHRLISEILSGEKIKFHIIESRTKEIASFQEKIDRPGKKYENPLKELSDLSAIRVIIYYNDDIKKVENILRKEFKIYEAESIDKSEELLPNEFGYLSSHLVVSLKEPRSILAEWQPLYQLKAEVQIRTVLQHAWASISHALQYKRRTDIPQQLRRKLFLLAGLFELADEQFVDMRNQHQVFAAKITGELKKGKKGIPINLISLTEFIETSPKIRKLVTLALSKNYRFDTPDPEGDYEPANHTSVVVEECARFGIKTIDQLAELISNPKHNWDKYLKAIWVQHWSLSRGFFLYLLIIKIFSQEFTSEYLVTTGGWSESIAKRVIDGAKNN